MRKYIKIIIAVIISVSVSSCYVNDRRHRELPPGQAKKVYGSKSAKRYAPGQQKKKGRKKNNGNKHGHYKHDVYYYYHH